MSAKFEKHSLKTVRVVDYTNSIPYSAKKLPKCLKGCNSVKINSSSIENPHAHLQYVNKMSAKLKKHDLKTVGGADYTNSIPDSARKLPK